MEGSLTVKIDAGLDSDTEELEELTLGLRDELLGLDVETIERPAGPQPPRDAKGPLTEDLAGTLVITLSNSTVLVALVGLLRSWISRHRTRSATIQFGSDKIDVKGLSEEQIAYLIRWWTETYDNRGS